MTQSRGSVTCPRTKQGMIEIEELLGRSLNRVERRNAPRTLYFAGCADMVPLPGPRVSVVGTRDPTPHGLEVAHRVAAWLASRGVVVVSGLARGIDTAAHVAAMGAGGRTVAVLGTPLDRFYPPENRELQLRMMREQLVVSQFPPDHVTRPRDFPARNRTMALLSNATVIVEAGERSGTISQGWEALRLGRPLYIWRDTFERGWKWVEEMVEYGARVLDEGGLDDLMDELPRNPWGLILQI
ncbi:MAG: DNA-processing protein DprA [Conexivisphaera sp.]